MTNNMLGYMSWLALGIIIGGTLVAADAMNAGMDLDLIRDSLAYVVKTAALMFMYGCACWTFNLFYPDIRQFVVRKYRELRGY